ncbi:MAG: hypothetical protein E7554_09945 [Ruminococcaceae bacterium]|nr:hypothetical protein [Oscillospiraceae bacterium]
MAMDEASNAQIAAATGLPLSEIYAFRSRNNITRDKVRMLLSGKNSKKTGTTTSKLPVKMDDALTAIVTKCGGKLDTVVAYILAAVDEQETCKFCEARSAGDCESVGTCAPAVAAYLRERDGHA